MIDPLPDTHPPILALFQKRIDGDDALLQLAALRFKEAGLGPEFYAETPEELERLLRFKPTPEVPATVHLPRWINLFDENSRALVLDFANNFKNRIFGIIIHDQSELSVSFDNYLTVLSGLESQLRSIRGSPYLFIEYAAGLEPDLFIELFRASHSLERVSSCIDIGHLGLWQARRVYSAKYPGKDVCALKPTDAGLQDVIGNVQEAVSAALAEVLRVTSEIGSLGKRVHYHLHDAHLLSTLSPFGVADHLSFLDKIMLPFEYMGGRSLDLMFGPCGLSRIIAKALESPGPAHVSFTLEIHPVEGRLPLGDASYLFHHWRDKGNAERMNFWLSVLCKNYRLVSDAIKANSNVKSLMKNEEKQ
jgi:hypothetical protein